MPPSWNDIRIRAKKFADDWKDAKREESDKQTFWNEFFEIFGVQRKTVAIYESSVDRLGKGKGFIDLFWPGTLIVEHKSRGEPLEAAFKQATDYATNLHQSEHPRYIIVSDFRYIKLYDLATIGKQNEWTIGIEDLPKKADLFGFIAGYNKQEYTDEHEVDQKAVKKLTKLHDELRQTGYSGEDLEILLVRILFCMFAEDSGVFNKGQFHDYIYDRTAIDASDLGPKLILLFDTLNKKVQQRQSNLDESLQKFHYVNGKLFEKKIETPTFNHSMRDTLLDTARKTTWNEINPAIFGAMFQNVMQESGSKKRRELGAHYTSEKNILKVIKPLFLDELWAEFEEIKLNHGLLNEFHNKLAGLKFLDPACGCGNFLVVAYRELRKLELEVLKTIYQPATKLNIELNLESIVKCNVDQFYGIELEEFPAQVAQVAMWLTDAQMNNKASDLFGKQLLRLPLTHSASIFHGDALETDWRQVVKPSELNYIFGNPPFSGKHMQSTIQKSQITKLFGDKPGSGNLDFVAGWYAKAIEYIENTKVKVALVSTNSITQGEQVAILWKHMLNYGAKINFAHRTFKWSNEAGGKAAVYCVIIGFSLKDESKKIIYEYPMPDSEPVEILASRINPYLVDAENLLLEKRLDPISSAPSLLYGSKPVDGGNYLFTTIQKDDFIKNEPLSKPLFRRFLGADEFLNNEDRWCLWLKDTSPSELRKMPSVIERVNLVKEFRNNSKKIATKKSAEYPTLFGEDRHNNKPFLIIPEVSSENRQYIPIGFVKDVVSSNRNYTLRDAEIYHFGVITSRMHMAWVKYTCGRLEGRFTYSSKIVYNNFPWPKPNEQQKIVIENAAQKVLDVRKKYSKSTLADLYNLLTMPADLVKAHDELDKAVDKAYRKEPFNSDSERMQILFELYKKLA